MTEKKEIGFNTRCENLKHELIDNINKSDLPIGVIYYIMHTVMSDVTSTYYGVLNREAQEYVIETKKEETDND